MSSTTKRWATLLTAGALSLALTACGGDEDGQDPTTAPAPTTGAATTEGTGAGATEDDAATEGGDDAAASDGAGGSVDAAEGEEVPIEDFIAMLKAPGEEKLSTYTMSMELKSGSEGMTMEGAVDLSGDSPKMNLDMEVPGAGNMTMIMADGRIFMAMPGVTEEGKFLEVPEEQLGDAATSLDEVDLNSQYDAWEEGAQKVTFTGEEDVEGETMRRYEVVVDASVAADAAGMTGDDAAAMTSLGEAFVYDVWVDEEGLMRRIVMEIEGMVTEIKADNWGEPVDIEAPADSDLMTTPDMGGSTSGG